MALTVQVDGAAVGGTPNTIFASWFNDYHDLLTGTMKDQPITLWSSVILHGLSANPGAPTATLAAGTALGIGVYKYGVTFVDGNGGETGLGSSVSITTTTGNQDVNLTAIPTGPTGTVSRKVYRTVVGGSSYKLLTTIANNTATTYSDTTADGSLGAQAHAHNSMGGLTIQDSTGATRHLFYNDGTRLQNVDTTNANVTFDEVTDSHSGADWAVIVDQSGNYILWDNTNSRNIFKADFSGGALEVPQGVNGPYGTNRNGTITYVAIYTGGTTPSGNGTTTPATGALWAKA